MRQPVSFNDKIIDERIMERFLTLQRLGRLAHVYLFVGSKDIGKTQTALGVAKILNCQNISGNMFCDVCSPCTKINHGNHPDVRLISAMDGETIKIEQVRELTTSIQLKPFEAALKIFIIKEVEKLTLEATNALLKTLEEPTPENLVLLTTSSEENVLETVRSRCHKVSFLPISSQKLESILESLGLKKEQAHFLAYFSEGSFGRIKRLKDENIFEWKNEIIDDFILSRETAGCLERLVTEKNKEKMREALDVLLSWLRDLIFLKLHIGEVRLVNRDRLSDLKRFEIKYSFDELSKLTREVVEMRRLHDDNFNVKVVLNLIKESLWRT